MNYIIHKPFKGEAICGKVDLPVMMLCESTGGFIHDSTNVYCFDHSQNAYDYFARNDDGMGMERGNLCSRIIERLSNHTLSQDMRETLWEKIWEDDLCTKYRRAEHPDFWVWNHDFYNANIEDLRYIAKLIDA